MELLFLKLQVKCSNSGTLLCWTKSVHTDKLMNGSWQSQITFFDQKYKKTFVLKFCSYMCTLLHFLHTDVVEIHVQPSVFHSAVSKISDLSEEPPPKLHFTVQRGVNCRGVRGSTTVRACASASHTAWLPSVRTSHSVCHPYRLTSLHLPLSFCTSLPSNPSSSLFNPLYSESFYTFGVSAASRGYPFLQVSHMRVSRLNTCFIVWANRFCPVL